MLLMCNITLDAARQLTVGHCETLQFGTTQVNRTFKNKYAEVDRTKHHYFLFVVTKVSMSGSCSCATLILRLICVHDNVTRAAIRGFTESTDQCSSIDNSVGRHMTPGAGQGDTRCRLRKTARSASHVADKQTGIRNCWL